MKTKIPDLQILPNRGEALKLGDNISNISNACVTLAVKLVCYSVVDANVYYQVIIHKYTDYLI